MDSGLVVAILNHLNERGERDAVSDQFETLVKEPFDGKNFEAWKQEARFNLLSEHDKQREILFQARRQQVQLKKKQE